MSIVPHFLWVSFAIAITPSRSPMSNSKPIASLANHQMKAVLKPLALSMVGPNSRSLEPAFAGHSPRPSHSGGKEYGAEHVRIAPGNGFVGHESPQGRPKVTDEPRALSWSQ